MVGAGLPALAFTPVLTERPIVSVRPATAVRQPATLRDASPVFYRIDTPRRASDPADAPLSWSVDGDALVARNHGAAMIALGSVSLLHAGQRTDFRETWVAPYAAVRFTLKAGAPVAGDRVNWSYVTGQGAVTRGSTVL